MKRIIVVLPLVMLLLLSLVACGNVESVPEGIRGSYDGAWWGNTYYYIGVGTGTDKLRYQRMDDIRETGLPVYSDLLLSSEEDPFVDISMFQRIIVDPLATEKNDGFPVLILVASYWARGDEPSYMAILSYNTATNQATQIAKSVNAIGTFGIFLYGDVIYYTTHDGDKGMNLNRVNVDGTGYMKLENSEANVYSLLDISDGTVYFSNEGERAVYTCSLDFTNVQKIAEDLHTTYMSAVYGDYFYYPTREANDTTSYLNLRRIRTDGISEPELVLENVAIGAPLGNAYYYYPLDNMVTISYGGFALNHVQTVLYAYDFDTGETRMIYDTESNYLKQVYTYLSDRYLMLNIDDLANRQSYAYMVCVDLDTLETVKVPY